MRSQRDLFTIVSHSIENKSSNGISHSSATIKVNIDGTIRHTTADRRDAASAVFSAIIDAVGGHFPDTRKLKFVYCRVSATCFCDGEIKDDE